MAIFQPTNITPSNFAGVGGGVVAASDPMEISWQVNGDSQLRGILIDIADGNNDVFFAGNVVNSNSVISGNPFPFYPRDNKGNPQFFTFRLSNSASWLTYAGISDGHDYCFKLTQFWNDTVYLHKVTGSPLAAGTKYYISARIFSSESNTNVEFTPQYNVPVGSAVVLDPDNLTIGIYSSATYDDTNRVLTVNNGSAFTPIQCGVVDEPTGTPLNNYKYTGYRYVQQYSMTAFSARTAPTLTITEPSHDTVVQSFSATYSQAQLDTVKWVRWTVKNNTDNATIYDTGRIYTSQLTYTYNGFISGKNYTVNCDVETSSGVQVSAIATFDVSYSTTRYTDISAECNNDNSVTIKWTTSGDQSTALYKKNNEKLALIANNPATISQLKDYGIKSLEPRNYQLYYASDGIYNKYSRLANPVCVRFQSHTLLETIPDQTQENVYHVKNVWKFGTNVESNGISNNNTPDMLQNFTPYRLRQPSPQKGKSGTLTALLGNTYTAKQKGLWSPTEAYSPLSIVSSRQSFDGRNIVKYGTLPDTTGTIRASAFSPNGKWLVVGDGNYLRVYSLDGDTFTLRRSAGATSDVTYTTISFAPSGDYFVAGAKTTSSSSITDRAKLYSFNDETGAFSVVYACKTSSNTTLPYDCTATAFIDGKFIVGGGDDSHGYLYVYNANGASSSFSQELKAKYSNITLPFNKLISAISCPNEDIIRLAVFSSHAYLRYGVIQTYTYSNGAFEESNSVAYSLVHDTTSSVTLQYYGSGRANDFIFIGGRFDNEPKATGFRWDLSSNYDFSSYFTAAPIASTINATRMWVATADNSLYALTVTLGQLSKTQKYDIPASSPTAHNTLAISKDDAIIFFGNGSPNYGRTKSPIYYATKHNTNISPGVDDDWQSYWNAGSPPVSTYMDSAEQMEQLYDISTSENTFFLKDTKGNLYMVHTSDPITQTISLNSLQQEVSVTIPWEEIGDASDAVIIQLPTDDGYIMN